MLGSSGSSATAANGAGATLLGTCTFDAVCVESWGAVWSCAGDGVDAAKAIARTVSRSIAKDGVPRSAANRWNAEPLAGVKQRVEGRNVVWSVIVPFVLLVLRSVIRIDEAQKDSGCPETVTSNGRDPDAGGCSLTLCCGAAYAAHFGVGDSLLSSIKPGAQPPCPGEVWHRFRSGFALGAGRYQIGTRGPTLR
jgi:hypothetical protein